MMDKTTYGADTVLAGLEDSQLLLMHIQHCLAAFTLLPLNCMYRLRHFPIIADSGARCHKDKRAETRWK